MSLSHRQDRTKVEGFWGFTDRQWTRSGLTLAEGVTLVRRLLESPLDPEGVYCTEAHGPQMLELVAGRCPVHLLTQAEMERTAGFAFHRGVAAVARRPAALSLEAFLGAALPRRLAVAPRLTDPENLGALFRTALALGWDAVAVGPETCDPFSRRVAKVSMGAVYSHPPVELPNPATVSRLFHGTSWGHLALVLEPGAPDLEDWLASPQGKTVAAGPVALWVGNEFEGLDPAWRAICSQAIVIPMAEGCDSLNVAVASAIALYRLRFVNPRGEGPPEGTAGL